jgi:two-component system, sensor histidine kinase|tara:strand:+ start:67 stop:492 length:426 start_codon:yes stop_codon:yes gene_type:complete
VDRGRDWRRECFGQRPTFYFELNVEITNADEPRPKQDPDPRLGSPSGLRILIVEDNSINQYVIRAMLRDIGQKATTVSNGFEAVEALINNTFDLIFTDITTPGLYGISVMQQIRTIDSDAKYVPIIVCSAFVGNDVRDNYP